MQVIFFYLILRKFQRPLLCSEFTFKNRTNRDSHMVQNMNDLFTQHPGCPDTDISSLFLVQTQHTDIHLYFYKFYAEAFRNTRDHLFTFIIEALIKCSLMITSLYTYINDVIIHMTSYNSLDKGMKSFIFYLNPSSEHKKTCRLVSLSKLLRLFLCYRLSKNITSLVVQFKLKLGTQMQHKV